jgi:hypothetical protein
MRKHQARLAGMRNGAAIGLSLAFASAANAFSIDTDNPDFKIRWDNTLRYNMGVRVEKQDPAIINTPPFDNSDLKFKRGDLVANRFDLLSEFDVVYKGDHGIRLSGAAWYDQAYNDVTIKGTPGAYPGNVYNNYAKRYMRGPSGEILDAFAFTKFDLGNVPVNLKVGRHNVYWGESLFSLANGIAYSQGSLDAIKGTANPGSQAKELFLPLNQVSMQAQVTNDISIAAQYYLEWKPWRLAPGGTYFGTANFFNVEGGTFLAPGVPFNGSTDRPKDRGDWGVMARWSPEWLAGTAGVYYRDFSEKLPWLVVAPDFSESHLAYAQHTKLIGLSATKSFGGISFGSELSYRKNTALNSANVTSQGARGNTWHALVNMVQYFGGNALWDAAPLIAELNYTRLDKVTSNADKFAAQGSAACPGDVKSGCATRDAWAINLALEPVWYQVMPGVDLKLPLNVGVGLKGNGPALGSSRKGNGSWSVGVTAEVRNQYFITLRYADYLHEMGTANGRVVSNNGAGALYRDRGWLSLTLRTAF